MSPRTRVAGFTLIEVLVAIAIFGIMSALAYGALSQTISSSEILGERMNRLQSMQRAIRQLDSDFMQLAARPVRKDLGDTFSPALQADSLSGVALELTRAGWSNPTGMPRGTLQRVAYVVEDEELLRYYWNVLDRSYTNEPIVVSLLDGVDALQIRYLLDNGEWSERWPPETNAVNAGLRNRPRAVEIVLRLINEGDITRLIEVAP
ncbi:MAG: type II secretion system minor pseudopilin GspJ [Woeseia sp.]|nr:type II secretion system minor pseudopilin GspJ [Woeseia sp.]NNE59356.1 type II secretion system minor pseudopilin GspJ [Woeseia sp.]